MTYEDLLEALSDNKNLSVCKNNYLPQFFGDFVIEMLYKKRLKVQILNDKGIIEISIKFSKLFSITEVPLKYAVNYVQSDDKNIQGTYTFNNIDEAYSFFQNSYDVLDRIITEDLSQLIVNNWRKCPLPHFE